MSVSPPANLRYLTREELIERLNNAQNHKKEALRKIGKLSKIVAASIEQEGATLGDENHNVVNEIFNETPHTFQKTPPNFSYGSNKRRKPPKKKAVECDDTHSSSDGV